MARARTLDRSWNRSNCRLVENVINTVTGFGHRKLIEEIGFAEVQSLQISKVLLFAGGKVIESAHAFSASQQFPRDIASDESSYAGDKVSGH
jgi:hypothetical protein